MIKRTLILFTIITIVLYGFRKVHYYGLLKQNKGYYQTYKTAFLEKNEFNVLFLGSSRVQMHYNTFLFDSINQTNSFNLSMAGATPKVAYYALKIYLSKSKTPSIVLYDIDYHNLNNESKEIKDFNNYFPFLKDEVVRNEFCKIDKRFKWFYYLPYYSLPYTGSKNLSTGLHGLFNIPNRTDSLFYKGYFKENTRHALEVHQTKPSTIKIDPIERTYIDSLCQLAKIKKFEMLFISSPLFAGGKLDVANKEYLLNEVSNLVNSYEFSYTDLSSLSFCDQRELFVDHFHMNHKGARLFTLKMSKLYRNNLIKKALKP